MKALKTTREYFAELVLNNRQNMKLPDAFEAAKSTFEKEKGLRAPYNDSESFRVATRSRK